jgi:tetratricopeptide (TPR) repeat protein
MTNPRRRRTPWWRRILRDGQNFVGWHWQRFVGAFHRPKPRVRDGEGPRRRLSWWRRGLRGSWNIVEWNLALVWNVFHGPWIGQLRRYVARRWGQHRLVYLLQGLPALIVAGGAVALGVHLLQTSPQELNAAYIKAGDDALLKEDYESARTCFERVAGVEENQGTALYGTALFGLALAVDRLGQPDRAFTLLQQAAPRDRQGHGRAQIEIARRLMTLGGAPEQLLEEAQRHLEQALKSPSAGIEAHAMLGQIYLTRSRDPKLEDQKNQLLAKAEEHLNIARSVQPDLAWPLAQTYAGLGRRDLAQTTGREVRDRFQTLLKANPHNQRARMALTEVKMFLAEYAGAIAVLEEGLALEKSPEYNSVLARAYLAWSKALPNSVEQMEKLERAFFYDPGSPELIIGLWKSTSLKGEAADQARALLRKQVASGKASALSYLALGMDAWENKRSEEAEILLEKALELGPGMQPVVNNVALVLASKQPPELERALALINSILQHPDWSKHPICLDTRGFILARMGRWKEALTDMQKVLAAKPDDREVNLRLADIYDHLKMPEMADEHRKKAGEKAPK